MEWKNETEYGQGFFVGYHLHDAMPTVLKSAIDGFNKTPNDFSRGLKAGKEARIKELKRKKKENDSRESSEQLRIYLKEEKRQKDYDSKEPERKAQREAMQKKITEHKAREQAKEELLNPAKRRLMESEWIKQREQEVREKTRLETLNSIGQEKGKDTPDIKVDEKPTVEEVKPTDQDKEQKQSETPALPTEEKEKEIEEISVGEEAKEVEDKANEEVPQEKSTEEIRMEHLESLSPYNEVERDIEMQR